MKEWRNSLDDIDYDDCFRLFRDEPKILLRELTQLTGCRAISPAENLNVFTWPLLRDLARIHASKREMMG